jgi:hypothetical protein
MPNTFVFSPPVEGRWLGWYAAAHGYDGFLRWAYDAWPADPGRDARHVLWPAGDTFLVYPGGQSSIRFEKLREGIVDYEKLRLLRGWAANSADAEVRRLTNELDRLLESIAMERDYDPSRLRTALQAGIGTLSTLSDRLARRPRGPARAGLARNGHDAGGPHRSVVAPRTPEPPR